jgi:hypothetical protein
MAHAAPTTQTTSSTTNGMGCYGFRLSGVDEARELLVDAPRRWRPLALECLAMEGPTPVLDRVSPDRAALVLQSGGWVEIQRVAGRVRFHLPEPRPAGDLVHPYLAAAAALAARWAGRESFHAGAVIADGGAWAVLGDKEAGKSSTLAWLALRGHDVLTDDLLVLDPPLAFAGPRCIDLREEPAARFGAGEPLGTVGVRDRWRLTLGPVAPEVPLRGWITLAWGDDVAIDPLHGAERLLSLLPFRSLRLEPREPEALVELSSLPVLRLRRPRRWDSLPEVAARLLDAISS